MNASSHIIITSHYAALRSFYRQLLAIRVFYLELAFMTRRLLCSPFGVQLSFATLLADKTSGERQSLQCYSSTIHIQIYSTEEKRKIEPSNRLISCLVQSTCTRTNCAKLVASVSPIIVITRFYQFSSFFCPATKLIIRGACRLLLFST